MIINNINSTQRQNIRKQKFGNTLKEFPQAELYCEKYINKTPKTLDLGNILKKTFRRPKPETPMTKGKLYDTAMFFWENDIHLDGKGM